MSVETENRVTVKLFVGYQMTTEIKMLLSSSPQWKQDSLIPEKNQKRLKQVHYHDKDYIGHYMEYQTLVMKDLRESVEKIKCKLEEYCPTLNVQTLKTSVFPQVFVA